MGKTLYDINKDMTKLYNTKNNKYSDFPVGTRVKIVTRFQDSYFFFGEFGTVIENKGRYLGVIVEYDEPRHYEDGQVQKTFGFEPKDLVWWNAETKEISDEQERLAKMEEEDRNTEIDNKQRSERFRLMEL